MNNAFIAGLTKLMPEDFLLKELEQAIKRYGMNKSEDNKDHLKSSAIAVCIKLMDVGGKSELEEAMNITKLVSEHSKWQDLNPNNNQS